MFCRLITLLNHATHHGKKGFVQSLARSRHLLRNFFAVSVGLNEFLQTPQLTFNSGQTGTKGFLFFRVGNAAHGNLSGGQQIMITFASLFKHIFGTLLDAC